MAYHVLLHIRADDTAASHLDLQGLWQDPASQRLHGSGESCWEHDRLTVWTHVVNDTHHLVCESEGEKNISENFCHWTFSFAGSKLICPGFIKHYCDNHSSSAKHYTLKMLHLMLLMHEKLYVNVWSPTCGSKPMSNILSASSRTTYVTLRRLVTRPTH